MNAGAKDGYGGKDGDGALADSPGMAAIGLEAEFTLVIDGWPTKVEQLFRDPRDFLGGALVHRAGTSYHLPTGAAVYFDTGVIEVATPLIEIDRGCAARAGRSLWESIQVVRDGLAAWERRTGRRAALAGFSAHYNVSFDAGGEARPSRRSLDDLALLLCYILPCPVMLLATNRESTGVGVRPRRTRIEVTADFTPDPRLTVAAAAFITAAVRAVMRWPAFDLGQLRAHRLPVIAGYRPMRHTTRRGWLARFDCYPHNPFTADPDAAIWRARHVASEPDGVTPQSLRQIASRIFRHFRWPIARLADPPTLRDIGAVLNGRAASLLDLPRRPAAYDDVGRLCGWSRTGHERERSRYERVLMRALSGAPLVVDGERLTPVGTQGWSQVTFRREADGTQQTLSLDSLLPHLEAWENRRG